MPAKVTLDKVIWFLKLDLKFACCWPMPKGSTKRQIMADRVFRALSGLHGMLVVVELLYTVLYRVEDVLMFVQATSEMGIIFEVPLQIALFTLQHDRLQNIITEMEDCYRDATPEERNLYQKYIDNHMNVYLTVMGIITIALIISVLEPCLHGDNSTPLVIRYPFDVDHQPWRTIVYLHHVLALYQAYCQVTCNVFLGFLLWLATVRFEILTNKFRKVTQYVEWKMCVREHQNVLRFGQETCSALSYVVVASLTIGTYSLVFSGITMLSNLPLSVKAEFLVVCVSSLTKVYLSAWPADHLMRISSKIGDAAYESKWYENEVRSQKIMLFNVMRCQKPVIVTVPGILKTLNFEHYASYISTAFSFLTTFRIILAED